MLTEAALSTLIAGIFSMMNPIGNLGIFAGMTADRSEAEARRIAWTCAAAVAVTLLVVTWSGGLLLEFFGISIDSLRAAGGVIVLLIGLRMLFNNTDHTQTPQEAEEAKDRDSIAVVPLAIPIIAGPGTMAVVLVAAQQHPSILGKGEISGVILALSVFTGLLMSFAAPIAKRLGESGIGVVTRVMGLVLAAIAMGLLAEGLKGMLPGLAG
ncbi:MarC family protein [Oricola nitratireducens]|uniref:MarC family protein n=1 Tax=Oricola nitratireducens TaxID=2775868 RepID=UPI001868ED40|nr:MarC family protein [Oricola nitratireducens]